MTLYFWEVNYVLLPYCILQLKCTCFFTILVNMGFLCYIHVLYIFMQLTGFL